MQTSTETRWFFSNREEIKSLESWFAAFDLSLDKQSFDREDYYMNLPGINSLGLKIREAKKTTAGTWTGKLEAKVLLKNIGELQMEDGNSGLASQWAKFSFSLHDGEPTLEEILNSFVPGLPPTDDIKTHWIKMEKKRLLVKYDLLLKEYTLSSANMKEGCGIELTAIKVKGRVHYSFGLEGFSSSGKNEANFFETLNYLFSTLKAGGLRKANAYDYPQFLTMDS